MKPKWQIWVVVVSLWGLLIVPSSFSLDRDKDKDKELFQDHLVLSLIIGAGIPSDDFSSSTGGNHKSGGADVSLEFEWR